jgi:xanthine/uracil/vitamin C permease (AzgA family)
MKQIVNRLAVIAAGLALAYLQWTEFQDWLSDYLPAIGSLEHGFIVGQTLMLAFLGALAFGGVVALGYRTLSYLLD